jgi:hypothetical protein
MPASRDRHAVALADQIFIFYHDEWEVCDGAHWSDVMNWHALFGENPNR